MRKTNIMNLQLSLKTKWFDLTKKGIKTEDYREITPYWANRIFNKDDEGNGSVAFWKGYLGCSGIDGKRHFRYYGFKNKKSIDYVLSKFDFKDFKTNTMTLGYPKSGDKERILKLYHKGIEIRTGNPEWGAEPNKLYFVIKHGKPTE